MRAILKFMAIALCMLAPIFANSQAINPDILHNQWKAYWIAVPGAPLREYGIYHFRKNIDLPTRPAKFVVHVSADNRYKLYVNEHLVSLGPARGDMYYWKFETVDIAPYLQAGKNTVAALVWNEGDARPEAQITDRTAFILQGDTKAEDAINTDNTWCCTRDNAYKPITGIGYPTYYVAGPGELVDMHQMIKSWMSNNFNDSDWQTASRIDRGNPKGVVNGFGWMLIPSGLPQMELTPQRVASLRQATGVQVAASFPAQKTAITIPANTKAQLILDQTFLTNAYVTINFSGGDNAGISLTYAEAPLVNTGNANDVIKTNRNVIKGMKIIGRKDSLISDGSVNQTFTSMAFRTFRYVLVNISTLAQPLTIDDLYGTFTGYPFKLNAKLNLGDEAQKMLEVGWRTARSCAVETYMDCPYYEQLQYIGDGRIQALISYYNSGDDRLARNALNQMDQARLAEGVTLSRHPSYSPQIISTFSLWYIGMLHDYWMYRNDAAFIKNKLDGMRQVLAFFNRYQQPDGSLKNLPYWNFVDWISTKGWDFGQSPKDKDGNSAILDMQLMWAYQQAAEMEAVIGMPVFAAKYRAEAARLKTAIQAKYWVPSKGVYADTKDKDVYSQHTNAIAILSGMVSGPQLTSLAKKLATDTTLENTTIYFKYYVHQALVKGSLGTDYMKWLGIWRNDIAMGLTTWAEISDVQHNRSDCHAWGASPNIEFFRTVLGIDSYAPGFKRVKIEPHLGDMNTASGQIPHPNGSVKVSYTKTGEKWLMSISLPIGTDGAFVWKGKSYYLKGGLNTLRI